MNASGGGLTAGIALAVKARLPQACIYTAEPEGFDDHARSFRSGRRERTATLTGTMCDALMAQTPGRLTFEINRTLVGDGVTASEAEVARAVAFAFRELKLVVEPAAPSRWPRSWPASSTLRGRRRSWCYPGVMSIRNCLHGWWREAANWVGQGYGK